MARSVKVDLIANVQGYVAGMDRAAAATRAMSNDSVARLAQQRQAFDSLGRTALAVGVFAAAGVAIAIARFAEFDAAMSNVNAVTQETAENMDLLRDAALDAGGRTVFTATEAANAVEELGKAGIETADILSGALDASLDLAASGQLQVARAAEITATTLKQFGLEGAEAARVADVLSAGAGKALGSVEDLAQALKFVGPIAGVMGISLEDVTATLSLFADQGIIGEQAGTALRGMLASLQAPSAAAKEKLDELNITLYNESTGAFLGLESVVGQLNARLGDADDQTRDTALGIIFTNAQLTTAQTLVGEAGAKWGEYRDRVDESGYAARVAADRLDNLRGDLEKLGGAFDTVLIQQGSAANDTLRGLVQTLTFLVDASSDLPPVAVNIGLVTAAVALAGGAALIGVGKFADFKTSMAAAGLTARTTAVAVGGVTAALTAVTLIIGAFVSEAADAAANTEAFAESLDEASGAATQYTRDLAIKRLEEQKAFEIAEKIGISHEELTDALLEGGDAWSSITEDMREYVLAQNGGIGANTDQVSRIDALRSQLEGGMEAWKNETAANEEATVASEANADALAVLEGQAGDTSGAIDQLSNQILNFGKATLDTREAERQFQAALDDLTESVAENGATLDVNTEAGRANEAALDDIAEASLKRASAILLETGSQEEATAAVALGREELIKSLAQFDITGQAAEDYADKLGLIPSNIVTAAVLDTTGAESSMVKFFQRWDGKKIRIDRKSVV